MKSRAGLKLEAAIEQLDVDVDGKVALDAGLSTGGFTDCLLQHGASFVYGVDVGYGQVIFINFFHILFFTNSILLSVDEDIVLQSNPNFGSKIKFAHFLILKFFTFCLCHP